MESVPLVTVYTEMLSLFYWPDMPPVSPQTYASKTVLFFGGQSGNLWDGK